MSGCGAVQRRVDRAPARRGSPRSRSGGQWVPAIRTPGARALELRRGGLGHAGIAAEQEDRRAGRPAGGGQGADERGARDPFGQRGALEPAGPDQRHAVGGRRSACSTRARCSGSPATLRRTSRLTGQIQPPRLARAHRRARSPITSASLSAGDGQTHHPYGIRRRAGRNPFSLACRCDLYDVAARSRRLNPRSAAHRLRCVRHYALEPCMQTLPRGRGKGSNSKACPLT